MIRILIGFVFALLCVWMFFTLALLSTGDLSKALQFWNYRLMLTEQERDQEPYKLSAYDIEPMPLDPVLPELVFAGPGNVHYYQDKVRLYVFVLQSGKVDKVEILDDVVIGTNSLGNIAKDAIQTWQYLPGKYQKKSVNTYYLLEIRLPFDHNPGIKVIGKLPLYVPIIESYQQGPITVTNNTSHSPATQRRDSPAPNLNRSFHPLQYDQPPVLQSKADILWSKYTNDYEKPLDVVLSIEIYADGSVRKVTVVESTHPSINNLVCNHARNWRFVPATLMGRNIDTVYQIRLTADQSNSKNIWRK